MDIKKIQERIDETEYWDVEILDFQVSYFGDEITIYIYNDEISCWRIVFSVCFKVNYETDAYIRSIDHVKTMRGRQLCYFGQDITLSRSEYKGFYKVKMCLSVLDVEIECKEIKVEKINRNEVKFFWED